jgi:phosphate starvation-inducible membrane PsiE
MYLEAFMFEKRSLEFWLGLSFVSAGIITVVLLIHISTDGEDVIATVLMIPMALILLVLVIGLIITSSQRLKRDSQSRNRKQI